MVSPRKPDLLWCGDFGVAAYVTLNVRRLAGRIAVVGALVAALGLAGCGRKAGLDPPPGRRGLANRPPARNPAAEPDPDGKPVAAPGREKDHLPRLAASTEPVRARHSWRDGSRLRPAGRSAISLNVR